MQGAEREGENGSAMAARAELRRKIAYDASLQ
jgi:hypothetical protein